MEESASDCLLLGYLWDFFFLLVLGSVVILVRMPSLAFLLFLFKPNPSKCSLKLHFLTSSNLYISKNAYIRNTLVCCQRQKKRNEDVLPWLHTARWRCVQLPLRFVNRNKFTFVVDPIVPQFCSQLHTLVGVNMIAPRVPLSIASSHNRFIKASFEAVYR